MNNLTIIGNLTHSPQTKTTPQGKVVTTFTVAVARKGGGEDTDFFRVSAWEKLGQICAQYLTKGKKVAVTGAVYARAYETKEGEAKASLEVTANTVEFLSPREDATAFASHGAPARVDTGFEEIQDGDLPF